MCIVLVVADKEYYTLAYLADSSDCLSLKHPEMLNEAKSSRPRPGARGQGRGQELKADAKVQN